MTLISEAALKKDIKGKNILVDTNIIIYLTDDIAPYASLSRVLFEMVESGSVFACFSMVSIAEVLQGPLRKGMKQKALDVRDYLMNFPNSDCHPLRQKQAQDWHAAGNIRLHRPRGRAWLYPHGRRH